MNSTFSEEEILLFIYGEADEKLKTNLSSALLNDSQLRNQYDSLFATIFKLENVAFEPHDTSLKIIMEESALSQREEIC
jgi:hypothetical protein